MERLLATGWPQGNTQHHSRHLHRRVRQFCCAPGRLGETDVHVVGFPGCYDNAYAIRLMLSLATHPNVGACLAIGLGCEYTQPSRIAAAAASSGRPSRWYYIQDSGGTRAGIDEGKAVLNVLRKEMEAKTVSVP